MILAMVILVWLAALPILFQRLRRDRRRRMMAAQFRLSLQSMVHGLHAGVGLAQALDRTAKECPPPLAAEWDRLLQSVRLGQSLPEALEEFSRRVPMKETAWFATAVQITQSTGGSLADVLETLAGALQEAETFRLKVKAMTAQGRASGTLLSILPFLVMGAFYGVAPELARPLFVTAAGQGIIAGALISLSIGGLVIRKIVAVNLD